MLSIKERQNASLSSLNSIESFSSIHTFLFLVEKQNAGGVQQSLDKEWMSLISTWKKYFANKGSVAYTSWTTTYMVSSIVAQKVLKRKFCIYFHPLFHPTSMLKYRLREESSRQVLLLHCRMEHDAILLRLLILINSNKMMSDTQRIPFHLCDNVVVGAVHHYSPAPLLNPAYL